MSFSTSSSNNSVHSVKYLLLVGVSGAIVVIAAFAFFLLSFSTPIEAGRWVNECIVIKRNAVKQLTPKIVILSGSNGLFGFSAQRLTELHKIQAVNASVHAGLGIDYILYLGRQQIAPGRIIVLPLEFQLYGKRKLANDAILFQVLGYDAKYFWELPVADKLSMFFDISPLNRVRLIGNMVRPAQKSGGGYQSGTLNGYGDETANKPQFVTESMIRHVKGRTLEVFSHDDAAWQIIAKFAAEAKELGAEAILAYPNIFSDALDLRKNDAFLRELRFRAKSIGIRIIGAPEDSVFKENDIYDSVYHQNTEGQIRSTDRLLRELRTVGAV